MAEGILDLDSEMISLRPSQSLSICFTGIRFEVLRH